MIVVTADPDVREAAVTVLAVLVTAEPVVGTNSRSVRIAVALAVVCPRTDGTVT